MDPNTEALLNRTFRLQFLADVIALDLLCHSDSLQSLQFAVQSLNRRDRQNFLNGFRLAIATPLNELLKFIVGSADCLGLEYDAQLDHWLAYVPRDRGSSLLSVISNRESRLADVCHHLDHLVTVLRQSSNGLSETTEAAKECGAFASFWRQALQGSCFISLESGLQVDYSDSLVTKVVAERVLDFVWTRGSVASAFHSVWTPDEKVQYLSDDRVLDSQTHLDPVSSWPFREGIPNRWRYGVMFGFDSIIRRLGVRLPLHVESNDGYRDGNAWLNELRNFVSPQYPFGSWPSMEFGISQLPSSALDKIRERYTREVAKMEPVSAKDRLAAIWGPDRVRLFTPGSFTDFMDLEVFLTGLATTQPESPVTVLVLKHSVEPDDREWVSIAVCCPRQTLFSNHTRWYLFYKMYHEGFIIDSDVDRAMREIGSLFLKMGDHLDVNELSGISDRDLLSFCELPAFRAMHESNRKLVDSNSDLRAGVSELLVGLWLQYNNYTNVKVSFQSPALGEFEYDSLGIKEGECLVLEVKGGSVLDEDLRTQVRKFGTKIKSLGERLSALSQALQFDGPIERASGVFVSLARLDESDAIGHPTPVWDYDEFVGRLRRAGVSDRLVDLLDVGHVIRTVSLDGFSEDLFATGL